MDASQKNDGLWLAAASATLAGIVLAQPLISLGAASLAALLSFLSHAKPAYAAGAGCRDSLARRLGDDLAKPLMLRGFGGRDGSSRTPTSDSPEGTEDEGPRPRPSGKNDRGSRSYREFAAGLEEEEQEISFLPPYASDNADGSEKATSSDKADGATESLLLGDLQDAEAAGKIPVARRFALGTVAIIRRLLEPEDVEKILIEQRRYPRLRFGDVAVQLTLLSEAEVQELLVAQEQGLFSDEEISDARRRLSSYHTGGAG